MAYDKVLTYTNNAWQGITQKPRIYENGTWREQNSMQVQVSGVWQELLTGGSGGYLCIGSSGNVAWTSDFTTFETATSLPSGVNVYDLKEVRYNADLNRWEIIPKSGATIDWQGNVSLSKTAYYNADSKAMGAWVQFTYSPDYNVSVSYEYSTSSGFRFTISTRGTYVNCDVDVYNRNPSFSTFTDVEYCEVDENTLAITVGFEYTYYESGDQYTGTSSFSAILREIGGSSYQADLYGLLYSLKPLDVDGVIYNLACYDRNSGLVLVSVGSTSATVSYTNGKASYSSDDIGLFSDGEYLYETADANDLYSGEVSTAGGGSMYDLYINWTNVFSNSYYICGC